MHIYNTDHMSCSGSPGTQMGLMEIRLLGYLSYESCRTQAGLLSSYLSGADAKAVTIKMNWNIFRWLSLNKQRRRQSSWPASLHVSVHSIFGPFLHGNKLLFAAGLRAHAGASGTSMKVVLPQTNSMRLGALVSAIRNQPSSPSPIKPVNSYFYACSATIFASASLGHQMRLPW